MKDTVIQVKGLTANLAKYNGTIVREPAEPLQEGGNENPNQRYNVRLADKLYMELPSVNLRVMVDYDAAENQDGWQSIQQSPEKVEGGGGKKVKGSSLNNRNNLQQTVVSLTSQLRTAVAAQGGISVKELFLQVRSPSPTQPVTTPNPITH